MYVCVRAAVLAALTLKGAMEVFYKLFKTAEIWVSVSDGSHMVGGSAFPRFGPEALLKPKLQILVIQFN